MSRLPHAPFRVLPLLAALSALSAACGPASRAQVAGADAAALTARADTMPPGRVLLITSDPSGARVYDEGVLLGVTPLSVAPGAGAGGAAGDTFRLTILGADPGIWLAPVATDSVAFPAPGAGPETLARHYVLPLAAQITSEPQGAEVLLGDSLLGTTPLFVSIPGPVAAVILREEGFGPQTLLIGREATYYRAELRPLDPAAAPEQPAVAAAQGKSRTTLFIAAGSAVVTGAAAAWLKNRADNFYEEYRAGGDPAVLDRMRRYDLLSGIALSVAQISLGYLILELLSR